MVRFLKWAGGAAWSARLPVTEQIEGSNPFRPARFHKINHIA